MSSAYNKLTILIKRIRFRIVFSTLIENLVLFTGVILLAFFSYFLLTYLLPFPNTLRLFLLRIYLFFLSTGFLLFLYLRLSKYWEQEKIALQVGKIYPNLKDNFLNALQLGRKSQPYFSPVLVNALVEEISKKIGIVKPYRVFPPSQLKRYLFFTSFSFLLVFSTCLLFPKSFSYSLTHLFLPESPIGLNISPGNLSLARGSSLEITAEIAPDLRRTLSAKEKVLLFYRYEKQKWNRNPMSFEESTLSGIPKYSFSFPSILENLEYRVAFGKISSPSYQIKIISPPEIGDLSFEYHYPSYTQLPAEKIEKTNGDIYTLLGTEVTLEAKVSKPLKKADLVFADGQVKELKSASWRTKKTVAGEILVNKENTYWFELLDEEGYNNPDPTKYKIKIKNDEFPKIEFLSPEEDLVVSEKSKLKLTYEANDDFGLKQVALFYRPEKEKDLPAGEAGWHSLPVAYFSPGTKEKLADWEWDLNKFTFSPGEIVEYYLEVADNDTISGPKKSSTKILKIEIFSYEREHQNIEQELSAFRENLLDLLAEQLSAEKLTDKISQLPPEQQPFSWQELENRQKEISDKTGESIKNLAQTLERMKNDPLTTQRTYEEYSGLKDNLEYLHQKPMQEIFTPLKEKNLPETKNKEEEIVTNLEKMSLLSEDILEYQRMYDLLTRAEELNELGNQLTENLEKLSREVSTSGVSISLDEKTVKEFKQMLDKVGELFNKIQQLLTKMPEQLPEEFINQPAVKEINLGETEDLFSQLQQALNRGDLKSALEYAKSLADNLSKILETLQQSAQTSAYREMDKLGQELEKHTRELDTLIEEENKEVEKTTKYEQKRLDKLLQFQEKLLDELAKRQKKVIEQTKEVNTSAGDKFPDFASSIQGVSGSVLPKMEKVYTEFSEKKVYDSVKLLEEIINEYKNLNGHLESISNQQIQEYADWQKISAELEKKGEKSDPEQGRKLTEKTENLKLTSDETKSIENEEKAILDLLRKSSKMDNAGFFEEKEKGDLQNLGNRQDELAQRTRNLNIQIQTLGQKSALLGPELSSNLRNAQKSMQDAENGLKQYSTGEALDKEKDALYWLSQGREGISQAMQKLAGSEKKVSQPVAGFIQYPRTGVLGVKIGYVKLPGAEEYKPPKEFREEILEALKEKYPKLYEDLVKEYYKRLTE